MEDLGFDLHLLAISQSVIHDTSNVEITQSGEKAHHATTLPSSPCRGQGNLA